MKRKDYFRPSWNELESQSFAGRAKTLQTKNLSQHRDNESKQIHTIQAELNEIPPRFIQKLGNISKDERPNLSDPYFDLNIETDQLKCICSCGHGFLSKVHIHHNSRVVHHDGCPLLDKTENTSNSNKKSRIKRRYLTDTTQVLVVPHWMYPGNKFKKDFNGARTEMKEANLLDTSTGHYSPEYLIIDKNDSNNGNNDATMGTRTDFDTDDSDQNDEDYDIKHSPPQEIKKQNISMVDQNQKYNAINKQISFCFMIKSDKARERGKSIVFMEASEQSGYYIFIASSRIKRIKKEIKLIEMVSCENIIDIVHEYHVPNTLSGIITPAYDPNIGLLRNHIDGNDNAISTTATKLCKDVSNGLSAMHKLGVVHCGISYESVGIYNDRFVIADCAQATPIGGIMEDVDVRIAAPEYIQLAITEKLHEYSLSVKLDSWQLGILLTTFITNNFPIKLDEAYNYWDVFIQQSRVESKLIVSPTWTGWVIDSWLMNIVKSLIDIKPAERPSCFELNKNANIMNLAQNGTLKSALSSVGYRTPTLIVPPATQMKKIMISSGQIINPYIP